MNYKMHKDPWGHNRDFIRERKQGFEKSCYFSRSITRKMGKESFFYYNIYICVKNKIYGLILEVYP